MRAPYPDSMEFEAALIAGILAKPSVFLEIDESLEPDDFADNFYGEIWRHAATMIQETRTISPVVLAAHLKQFETQDFKPQAELARLLASAVTTNGVPQYAKIIAEAARLRHLHGNITQASSKIGTATLGVGEADEISSGLMAAILEATTSRSELLGFKALTQRARQRLEEDIPATSTGFPRLDAALGGGLYPGRLYGLCAQQKVGKTSMLGSIAYQLCEQDIGWCYAALEMGSDQIYERLLARHMNCNSLDFLDRERRQQNWFQKGFSSATSWFEDKDCVFRTRPGMHLDELLSLLARIALSGRYRGVFIDYLQLIGGRPKSTNETYWYDEVAQALAEAAKRFNIWIVVAAQIGRNDSVYGGDGLGRACDVNLKLVPVERTASDPPGLPHRAWIEMLASRYTPLGDVGSAAMPAYSLNQSAGPCFEEYGPPSDTRSASRYDRTQ